MNILKYLKDNENNLIEILKLRGITAFNTTDSIIKIENVSGSLDVCIKEKHKEEKLSNISEINICNHNKNNNITFWEAGLIGNGLRIEFYEDWAEMKFLKIEESEFTKSTTDDNKSINIPSKYKLSSPQNLYNVLKSILFFTEIDAQDLFLKEEYKNKCITHDVWINSFDTTLNKISQIFNQGEIVDISGYCIERNKELQDNLKTIY